MLKSRTRESAASTVCAVRAPLSSKLFSIAVMMAELALVTPPVGANVFVMRRTAPEVPMSDIFMGVLPFVVGELVIIALVIAFPEIALWLPRQMN